MAAIIFTALVLLSVNIGWWWYYQSMTTYLEKQLSGRLTGIAATVSLHIGAEDIDALLMDNLDVYAKTVLFLDSLTRIDSLSEATIIDLDFNYIVSTREDMPEDGYLLAQLNLDALQQAIYGRTVASRLYNIDGTYLKSAYSPLFDNDNNVVALCVVEAGAGYFDLLTALRRNLYILAGGSAGVVLLLLIFYMIFNRHLAEAEEKLFQAGSQAALGRMVAVVSHEIKNPLMILHAAGERLQKKYDDPEASFITEEVDRLDGIVSGYLSFARGDVAIAKDSLDLIDMCDKIISRILPQFEAKGVKLIKELPDALPSVNADRIGLRQVILNLLLNGLQAVEENDKKEKQVIISLHGASNTVILRVSDTGPGIKPSQREKLFEPFFTTKTQGSGLGLYLCRKIVELHNGGICIVDNDKQMTIFEVTLPIGE